MKYLQHFNLSEDPFKVKMFFETKATREATERMNITVESGGIMHLIGKYGVGKSELLDNFISGLHCSETAVLLNYTSLSPYCFLLKLSTELGLPTRNNTANLVTQIHNYIEKSTSKIVFIIDESHNLNSKTIEAIKLIINPYLSGDTVSIIMSSPPEMKDVLAISPSFKQRIRMTYTLPQLNIEESKNYFSERLKLKLEVKNVLVFLKLIILNTKMEHFQELVQFTKAIIQRHFILTKRKKFLIVGQNVVVLIFLILLLNLII